LTSTDTDTVSSAMADNVKLTLDTRPPDPSPTSPPAAFGADTGVTVRLASGRIGSSGPIAVVLSNANAFSVTGTLRAQTVKAISARRKRVRLGTKGFTVPATSQQTVKLALPKALRRELKRKRRLALRLSVVVEDPAGNSRTVRKRVSPRLKPRR
jgi:hypothetical protein